jgi:hypothetical protein
MKCPKCESFKINWSDVYNNNYCYDCKCTWTNWQQIEIQTLKEEIEICRKLVQTAENSTEEFKKIAIRLSNKNRELQAKNKG